MARYAIGFGVVLIALSVGLYFSAEPEHRSPTAWIPSYFGTALVVAGLVALSSSPKVRMHAMHAAALVGVIGIAIPGFNANRALMNGAGFTRPVVAQLAMAAICSAFVIFCVKSFIDIRRARKQGEPPA